MVFVQIVKNVLNQHSILRRILKGKNVVRKGRYSHNDSTRIVDNHTAISTPINTPIAYREPAEWNKINDMKNDKTNELNIQAEKNYLIEFINREKIIYEDVEDLITFCDKFRKVRCDLRILTSSNREYVPYHLFDFFLSHRSFEKVHKNLSQKLEKLIGRQDCSISFCKQDRADGVDGSGSGCDHIDSNDHVDIFVDLFLNNPDNFPEKGKQNTKHGENTIRKKHVCESKTIRDCGEGLSLLQFREVNHLEIDSYIKLSLQRNFHMKYFTTVQYCLFPLFIKNFDLLIHSVKGTGKTLSYCIPLIHKIITQLSKLKRHFHQIKESYVFALIVCPNIILVEQTYAIIKKLLIYHPYNISCHYMHGRKNMNMQGEIMELKKKKPHIIVTTPVSFINHIKFSTSFKDMFFLCDTIIIDEAYFLLNSNYLKNILIIKNVLPKGHQTILLTCLVNNFLKHLAYRFLRLNYVHLNFVHNCVYDNDTFADATLTNIKKSNASPKLYQVQDSTSADENKLPFQLYNKFNAKLISIYRNNILNCTDIGKLWYCKNAKTFYNHINMFDAYIVGNFCTSETNYTDTLGHSTQMNKISSAIELPSENVQNGDSLSKSREDPLREQDMTNQKGKNDRVKEYLFHKNECKKNEDIMMKADEREERKKRKINQGTLKLNHSDYNNYTQYSRNHPDYEINKGKNIPTHILLRQEYLIYESDKLALILFNIIHKEFLSNKKIKIVLFMPTVKMIQFFYVIFKHYIFKGYIYLLYLKAKNFTNGKKMPSNFTNGNYSFANCTYGNSFEGYYDKEHVNFSVSSIPFVFTESKLCITSVQGCQDENASNELQQENVFPNLIDIKSPQLDKRYPKNREISNIANESKGEEEVEKQMCHIDDMYQDEYMILKDIVISCLHSKMSLDKKMYTLNSFNSSDGREKKILFTSSLLCQGIELDNVDLVIQVGVCSTIDEYILRTNLATSKNTHGRSLLLLNELEGHYLFTLYKNNIIISSISKSYLNYIYKDNPILDALLKYKRERTSVTIKHDKEKQRSTDKESISQEEEISLGNAYNEDNVNGEEVNYTEKQTEMEMNAKEKIHDVHNSPLRHIEWHKHEHLLCSCELMYRSLLGFYCEKSKFFKYEKWQVPSLIKNIVYSFGYFENFYITKEMAARLQIINAPDLYIKFNATPRSVLMSALPSYKGYKSKINELRLKGRLSNSSADTTPCGDIPVRRDEINKNEDSTFNTEHRPNDLEKYSRRKPEHVMLEKCENGDYEKHPLYFPMRTYLS
ncbi:RNA helicase [Plasmodium gonderi]|uniref:ATP-dependent RNA helicase n=1 Tax=Plasmodium gonderi TaxID=77519 RepID=A0A1Y1J9V8_PLAGO|nr:RNA helicase [Plasmodium gonderi]GAW79291.1 RNA helicase [Plasmodium gonderi]